jgi:hypothetical protein
MTMINQYNLTDAIYQLPDIINFPTKEVHIVCPALKKNSLCSYLLINKCDMDIAEVGRLCDTVNYKKETGCLYPRYHLTIFPIYDAIKQTDFEKACDYISEDIMKANKMYYKNSKMLFVLDDYEWKMPDLLLNQLREKINIRDYQILKEVNLHVLDKYIK